MSTRLVNRGRRLAAAGNRLAAARPLARVARSRALKIPCITRVNGGEPGGAPAVMKKSFLLPISLAVMAFLVLPLPGVSAPLSTRIEQKRDQIDRRKAREGVLSTTIQRFSTRISAVQGEIAATERRLARAQSSLDRQKAKLLEVRNRLEEARDRLERLRSELATARRVLAKRLVEIYKADSPDALTVILSADGFGDLLERDQIAAVESQLVGARDQLASARADKRGALAQVRDSRVRLEGDLAALEREQARVQAAIQGASGGSFKQGSGQLSWPVSGAVVSPFGMRWGRLHAGIDIAVPSGTAIHAADGGRVILMGWVGGYGNYTCIQHTGTLSTCYAHQSSFATSNGASVSQGQVVGYVGCTGHCFGDHLHFETRVNGSPVDPMGYL